MRSLKIAFYREGKIIYYVIIGGDFYLKISRKIDTHSLTGGGVPAKLKNLESQTVGEFITPKHNHKIEKYRFCKEAKKRLIKIKLDDCDELYSVHINSI